MIKSLPRNASIRGQIATRAYQVCAETVPEAYGLSSSTVSRRFIKASAQKLKQFQDRSLAQYDLVALFIDGKTFAEYEMIIALGVTIEGDKIPLGFVQAATENERVCRQFIQSLINRDLSYHKGSAVSKLQVLTARKAYMGMPLQRHFLATWTSKIVVNRTIYIEDYVTSYL